MASQEDLVAAFKKLETSMNVASPDREELVRLMSEIHDILAQNDTLSCSFDQKALREKAAVAVLEPALAELLKERLLKHVAVPLVRARVVDLNTTACMLVAGELKDIIESAALAALTAALETRGAILIGAGHIADSADWLEKLCRKYPTKRALQQCKWATVEALLEGALTAEVEKAVWAVWSEGSELRKKVDVFGLRPGVADQIVDNGFQSIEAMKQSDLEEIQQGKTEGFKAKLRRMWVAESKDGRAESDLVAKERERLSTKTKEAEKLVSEMMKDIGTARASTESAVSKALENTLASLGMKEWSSSIARVEDPAQMTSKLKELGNVLESAGATIAKSTNNYVNDDVIWRASAGLALYAVSFDYSRSELGKKAPRPLLRMPEYCPLLSPSMGTQMKASVFTSTESADTYRASIASSGASITAALKASGWGFHANVSHSTAMSEVSKEKVKTAQRSTTAVSVDYGVVPVKSFRISQEQMKLSSEAEKAVLAVTTLAEARRFLEDFGSHVPCGTQHLGGIFWKIVEIRTKDEVESQELENALARASDTSVGVSAPVKGVDVGAAVGVQTSSSSGTATGFVHQNRSYTATTRIECTGPNVSNYDLFSQVLAVDNTSWFLIDRGEPMALVAVWDLLSPVDSPKGNAIVKIQKLLRSAWIETAKELVSLPNFKHLLHRAEIYERVQGTPLELDRSDEKQSHLKVSKIVNDVGSISVENAESQLIRETLEAAFNAMFVFDYWFGTFVVAEHMRGGALRDFLSTLASRAAMPNVQPALQYLCTVLDTQMKAKLLCAVPPVQLEGNLETVLDNIRSKAIVPLATDIEQRIWQPPAVSLSDLPATVMDIANAVMQSAPNDSTLLKERVGSVLALNLWRRSESKSSSLWNSLVEVASKFYCTQDGFSFPLTRESLLVLVTEMEQVVRPPPKIEVVLPEDVSRFTFDVDPSQSDGLPYSYIRVDRRMPDTIQDLQNCILYVLIHRLDIRSLLRPNRQFVASGDSVRSEPESEPRAPRRGRAARLPVKRGTEGVEQPKHESVFNAAVRLLLSLDASARSEVIRLLLERRFIVPFIFPTSAAKDNAPFHCDLTSLGLITTAVSHDGEDIVRANLVTDTAHMRVAVLSNREKEKSASADWIEAVFHVQSFHAVDCKNKRALSETETAAEIGWGFLKDAQSGAYVPVVLLHVVGDYRPLRQFIAAFADAVVLDAESSDDTTRCDVELEHGALVKWSHADPDEEPVVESSEEDPVYVVSLRCKYTESIRRITEFLLGELEESQGRQERTPLIRMQPNEVYMAQAPRFDFGALEATTSFADLRSKFELQILFRQESQVVIASQRESDPMASTRQQAMIATFQRQRQEVAPSVDRHDVIMLFKDILRIKAASSRVISLLDLERWLSKQCEEQGVNARQVYREARNAWQKDRSVARREKMMKMLHDWDMKTVTMEHLWRELSHLYVADRTNRGYLANLAARHLLDGFSLELMDGDAGMMNLAWIQGVLKELHQMIGKARLLVLSIMGVQSSGKSTLLNYMFGVRLRASVSRCTRGVSIQLMKCEGRTEYEYVLLMDTEGIRAPEYNNTEDSVWRDNRMATFTILPADATIILTKGEETATINEILPIVLAAYLESETAQTNGGHFPSKLLFVFNQIDMTEKSKLENVVDTLTRELNENARKVEDIRHGDHLEETGQRTPAGSTQFFNDLNVDIANEETSDVRVLGTIKAESFPPKDAPLPDYGTRLVKLREHIHRRVCVGQGWRGRSVEEFSEYLTMVWKCIETSNFHFNFVAAFERINYDKLVHKMNQCKQQLTKHYNDAFDGISKEIHPSADKPHDSPGAAPEPSETFVNKLAVGMATHLEKLEADVDSTLKEERFSKWSTDQRNAWELYKVDQAAHWRRLVDELVNVFFKYEAIVDGYKKKLRARANDEFRKGDIKRLSPEQKQEQFDKLFDELAAEVDKNHPPFHKQVRAHVDQVFAHDHELSWVFKEKTSWSATVKSWLPKQFSDSEKQQRYARSINETVKRTLDGETKYSDGIVTKCIQLTKRALVDAEREMTVSDDMKRGVYRDVRELIRETLVEKQVQFDSENSVSARFQTCRPQMNTYFENLSKGWKGMDLLKASVRDWLSSNMDKSLKEELTAYVGTKLKDKRWVDNADVMQALVDNSLMQCLERDEVSTVFENIDDPRRHTVEVVSEQIVDKVDECIDEQRGYFKTALKRSIVEAAKAAVRVEKDRAMIFLASLKSQLGGYLKTSATGSPNSLLTTMPDAGDTNFNCDEQTADVFDPQNKEFVCADMLKDIDSMTAQSVDVTQDVLAYLKVRAHGASNGVLPRCGEPCPRCKSPCTRELGHISSVKEEEKRHDSYHQPVGLVGGHNVDNNELVPGSCYFNAQNGWSFKHSGEWHKYSEFDKVFPNWSLPVEKEPLRLREYIFRNYQDELASYHSHSKCTDIPPSYSHDKSAIKERINSLLS